MKVPLLDLKAQYIKIRDEIRIAMDVVCDTQYFILGPKVEKFEANVAAYCGVKHGVGVSSGTDSLLISLMDLGLNPGDEVITTPFTFFATAGVISRLKAKPVFVDIDPVTFNIDPTRIEKVITPKTKAIMPVHLFGQCADVDPITVVAQKHNLSVVEDAAQSIGAEYKGRRAGSFGDYGCFSFFPSKNLGAFGDAGMVVVNNMERYEHLRVLRMHGAKPKYYHKCIGGNFRLDALQAAVLDVKLKYLDQWSAARRHNADFYDRAFLSSGLVERGLVSTPKAVYKESGDTNHHIYNQYTIRAKNRDGLRAHLRDADIGVEIYYPVPLHLQDCYRYLGHKAGDFPESEQAADEVLALPIYPDLTEDQKTYVVDSIRSFYEE